MREKLYPRISRFARKAGILEGTTDYVRFIVLGRSRTGSNLLRGLLNSHSQIVVFGELFSNFNAMDWAYPGYQQTRRNMALAQSDPVRFVETEVFAPFPPEVAAVGFKIFYYHAHDHGWERLWPHLRDDQALRVIHIKRNNILRTHLSRKKAQATGVWVTQANTQGGSPPVQLDFQECLDDFVRTRAWEQEHDSYFADHPKMDLQYENLEKDLQTEMSRVQSFLGVRQETLRPETHRQSNQPLSMAIANYDELKMRFAGTPWQEFFEG